jgi:hypothetical protein
MCILSPRIQRWMARSIPIGNFMAPECPSAICRISEISLLLGVAVYEKEHLGRLAIGLCSLINRQQELPESSHSADKVLRLSEIKRSS